MKSWDCFDTLITRRFYHPHSIHDEVGKRLSIDGYAQQRLRAEKKTDGTIPGIYANLPGIDPAVEFQVEMDHCFGIVNMLNAVSDGDLIISDMYFTSEQVHTLLKNCGLKKKVTVIVTPAGKKYGTIWPTLGKIDLHTGDNLRSDVESPAKFGIPSSHYTNYQFNDIEQLIAETDFHLACWSRYIRLQCPYTDSRSIALWNDQANLNLPVLALATLELPVDQDIAFCYRDCAYWHQLYSSITGKAGTRLDVSRNCYSNPSDHFKEYLSEIIRKKLIVDMQGTGKSVKDYFLDTQKIMYIISENLENVAGLIGNVANAIERHNCTNIGPLLGWDERGPIRGECEHDLEVARLQQEVVLVACNSVKWFKINPDIKLLEKLVKAMAKNYTHKNVKYRKG
jgi:hypothetical protein